MKKMFSFLLVLSLIITSVSIPEKNVNASVLQETDSILWKADKLMGLKQYDEGYITDGDANDYDYRINMEYPSTYVVQEAEKRYGFTNLMDLRNKYKDKEYLEHPEYYYEAMLFSILFGTYEQEEVIEMQYLDKFQDMGKASSKLLKKEFGSGHMEKNLKEMEKKKVNSFTINEYKAAIKEQKNIELNMDVLQKVLELSDNAREVLDYCTTLTQVLELQEETITFLQSMHDRSSDENLKKALSDILWIYREKQEHPENLINLAIQYKATEKAYWQTVNFMIDEGFAMFKAKIEKLCPVLLACETIIKAGNFVAEKAFYIDKISQSYASLSAVYNIRKTARQALIDAGSRHKSAHTRESAGLFCTGWSLYLNILDADCQACAQYNDSIDTNVVADVSFAILSVFFDVETPGEGKEDFARYLELYRDSTNDWRSRINLALSNRLEVGNFVSDFSLPDEVVTLEKGKTYKVDPIYSPAEAPDAFCYLDSVHPYIASANGYKIKANNYGTTYVYVYGGVKQVRKELKVIVPKPDGNVERTYGNFKYKNDGYSIIITGYTGKEKTVTIPAEIDGLPVAIIQAFTGQDGSNTSTEKIVFKNGRVGIGNYAFHNCTALKTINLEEVGSLGKSAFANCTSLISVTLNRCSRIGEDAFYNCSSLKSLTLPKYLETIPSGLCFDCKSLKAVVFPKNVRTIEYWAFFRCGFTELKLPNTIRTLGMSAVGSCSKLRLLVLPTMLNSVTDDAIAFLNNDKTVYVVPKNSYMDQMFKKWKNTNKVKYIVKYPSKLKTSKSTYKVKAGKKVTIKYSFMPNYSSVTHTFASSNQKIATVSKTGKVTGKKKGTVTITIKGSDGQKATCKVKVKKGRTVKAKKIKKKTTIKSLKKGTSKTLKVKITPKNTTDTVKWSSSNKKIATVSQKGVVKAKKKGKVKITAKVRRKKVVWKLTIKEIPGKSVKLSTSEKNLTVGESYTLKATVTPKNTTDTLIWSSSNKSVASVTKTGKVTALKTGSTIITVKLGKKVTAACRITIKEQNSPATPGKDTPSSTTTEEPASDPADQPTRLSLSRTSLTMTGSYKSLDIDEEIALLKGEKAEIYAYLSGFTAEPESLSYKILAGNRNQKIRWSSSDYDVARVDSAGRIIATGPGNAEISVISSDGASATCNLTVNDTLQPSWTITDPAKADIQVAEDAESVVVTAKDTGSAVVRMTYGSETLSCPVTIAEDSSGSSTENTGSGSSTENTGSGSSSEDTGSGGQTGPTDEIHIRSAADILAINENPDADYILEQDINLSGRKWTPIGTKEQPFTGSFDGKGHTISGISFHLDELYSRGINHIGMFGYVKGESSSALARISNLTIQATVNGEINTSEKPLKYYIGAFAGSGENVLFSDCTNKTPLLIHSSTSAENDSNIDINVGGIIGGSTTANSLLLVNCSNLAAISVSSVGGSGGGVSAGGIIGSEAYDMTPAAYTVKNCINKAPVSGSLSLADTTSSYQDGDVFIGGIGGCLYSADIGFSNNLSEGVVSASLTKHKPSALGSGCYAGGIVGKRTSYNQITSCENTGTFQVNATDYSGENSISSGSGDIAGNTN